MHKKLGIHGEPTAAYVLRSILAKRRTFLSTHRQPSPVSRPVCSSQNRSHIVTWQKHLLSVLLTRNNPKRADAMSSWQNEPITLLHNADDIPPRSVWPPLRRQTIYPQHPHSFSRFTAAAKKVRCRRKGQFFYLEADRNCLKYKVLPDLPSKADMTTPDSW